MRLEQIARIGSVNRGQPQHYQSHGRSYWSSIVKSLVAGPVAVGPEEILGDTQADRKNHGGLDKAVHAHFRSSLQFLSDLAGMPVTPGQIGVNLAWEEAPGTALVDESVVCIGDVYVIGSVVLEVSQPRIPCYKQAAQLGDQPGLIDDILSSGRTGVYLRVLEPGSLAVGEAVWLRARPHPEWPVQRVSAMISGGDMRPAWEGLLNIPALGDGIREVARRRIGAKRPRY